uniref:Uncharacterized protein n=1 Tax=Chrysotila carterae TaxID=13221 RepID=A0A7S4EYB7_CHRCT|mmetsp:Transcript_31974/g.61572  ORF Transcript_31974/g.61572 Transcript_31974/m.61572 type:complete len:105 (-) Transcript_31974:878-1192(-)
MAQTSTQTNFDPQKGTSLVPFTVQLHTSALIDIWKRTPAQKLFSRLDKVDAQRLLCKVRRQARDEEVVGNEGLSAIVLTLPVFSVQPPRTLENVFEEASQSMET